MSDSNPDSEVPQGDDEKSSSMGVKGRRVYSWRKRLLFFSVAVLLCLSPLIVFEFILRLAQWEPPRESGDPFLGISEQYTLFEESSSELMQIRPQRQEFFRPAAFRIQKPGDGFRVFVVGGSTVQGRPWETETSFTSWLEICLKANMPDRFVEVVNCGGVSYASYRLANIVEEVTQYQPDLLIVMTGHNEFLEDRTYAAEKNLSPVLVEFHRQFSNFRSYQFARSTVLNWRSVKPSKSELGANLITRLDYENGLARFNGDTIQRPMVKMHFRHNINRMINHCREQGIRLLMVAPPANQKDCFPFKPTDDWSLDSESPYRSYTLNQFSQTDPPPSRADWYYLWASKLLEAGQPQLARHCFDQAIDLDICPLRMTNALRQTMHEVVEQQQHVGLNWVDLQSDLESIARDGIIGNELLVDHVHPTIATHQWIGQELTRVLQRRGWIPTVTTWPIDVVEAFELQMKRLDFAYFDRGQQRLKSVLRWSRGNAANPIKGTQ